MPIWDDGRLLDGPEADRHIVDGNATGCRFIQEPDSFWSLQHDIERASISVASPSGLGGVLRWVAIMPRIAPPNYTQIPNAILDASAEFSPAEFKVLCHIARQTFGWQRTWSPGKFTSCRAVAAATGLHRNSTRAALKSLTERGWLGRRLYGTAWSYRVKVAQSVCHTGTISVPHKRKGIKKEGSGADLKRPMPPDWLGDSDDWPDDEGVTDD